MVAGTEWPGGDPFLQRQNEPSIAVSTRNPQHILAGANDYRTVDIPKDPDSSDEQNADAWLGIFKSFDAGNSWKSYLLPGYPQDTSPAGLASPLHGLQAGSDPTVRAGTNGMFYYGGLVFDRTDGNGLVFVSRFIDNNNLENGDSISPIDTAVIQRNKKKWAVDKPAMAVDVPRSDAKTCKIPGTTTGTINVPAQRFPGGVVYFAYSAIDDADASASKILVVHSDDCGAKWSDAVRVSAPKTINQGASLAIDPVSGTVYIAWRQFYSSGAILPANTNSIYVASSTDGGKKFSDPVKIADLSSSLPDQPYSPNNPGAPQLNTWRTFRSNAYPTIAADANGRLYVAWADRASNERTLGGFSEWRISLATVKNGSLLPGWVLVDDLTNGAEVRGHQLMPSMTFAGGKLLVLYYDFRNDQLIQSQPSQDIVSDPIQNPALWHNVDVRVAEADPADVPQFYSTQVSRYRQTLAADGKTLVPLEINRPDFPLFNQGIVPFIGDYIDLASSPQFVLDSARQWVYNSAPNPSTAYHAAWTDNRDVVPPKDNVLDWPKYRPPSNVGLINGQPSLFDGQTPVQVCDATTYAGMRNQNIYTARIEQGLVVSAPANSKQLGTIQRAFPIVLQNTTTVTKTFQLTIANQPVGGRASFDQFQLLTTIWATVAARSSIARTVFATSTDPHGTVTIMVTEVAAVGSGVPVSGGLTGSVVLNPDVSNPDVSNPDVSNPDVSNFEVYNVTISNTVTVNTMPNSSLLNPDVSNPDVSNPDVSNPDVSNPDVSNFTLFNPDVSNPDVSNVNVYNPDVSNPDVSNSAVLDNVQVNDIIWTVKNKGNTTSTYSFKSLLSNQPNGYKFQLLVHRLSYTPVVQNCQLSLEEHSELLSNIKNPDVSNPDVSNPDVSNPDVSNVTFAIAPGDTVRAVLRAIDLDKTAADHPHMPVVTDAQFVASTVTVGTAKVVNAVVAASAVNTQDVAQGITQPPVAASTLAIINSRSLPVGFAGRSYSFQMQASGNVGTVVWTDISGAGVSGLPPGLTLSSTGLLSGTPTQPGAFSFTVQAQDSLLTVSDVFTVSVVTPGQPALAFVSQPNPCPNSDGQPNPVPGCSRVGVPITPPVSVRAMDASGSVLANLNVVISIDSGPAGAALTGSTSAVTDSNGIAVFPTLGVTLPTTPPSPLYVLKAAASGSLTFNTVKTSPFNVIAQVAFAAAVTPDAVLNTQYQTTFPAGGGIPPLTWSVVNPTQNPLPPGLTLNSSTGVISGTPQSAGMYPFTVSVTDSVSPQESNSRNVSIRVATALSIVDNRLPDAIVGTPYTQYLTIVGGTGAHTCTAAPSSPGGVSFIGSGCNFNGTPNAAGDYAVLVTVTDSSSPPQIVQKTLGFHIANPLQITTASPLTAASTGGFYTITFATSGGTAPMVWSPDPINPLPPGLSLNSATGVLSGTPTQSGTFTFNISANDAGQPPQSATKSFSLTVNPLTITTPTDLGAVSVGTYQTPLTAQGGTPPYAWSLTGGSLPPGLLVSTRVPQIAPQWSAGVIGVATVPGTYNFTVSVQDSTGATATQSETLQITSLITTDLPNLPDAFVGEPYSYSLATLGIIDASPTWAFSGDMTSVDGLSLSSSGQLTGTPVSPGTYRFTAAITDPTSNATILRGYSLLVSAIKIETSPMLPNATAFTPYSVTLTATGGTGSYTWSAPVPFGTLDSSTGVISGTPGNISGASRFFVTVRDTANNSYSKEFAVTTVGIPALLPTIGVFGLNEFFGLSDWTVGQSSLQGLIGNGSTAPFTWSATGLPSGTTIKSASAVSSGLGPTDAQIVGAVETAGTYPITVSLTDSSSAPVTVSRQVTLHVSTLNIDPPASGTIGVPYSYSLRPIGGTAPWTAQMTSGVLPQGLSMDSTGLITGTPAESGTFIFTVHVTDAATATLDRLLAIFINPTGTTGGLGPSIFNAAVLPDATLNQFYSINLVPSGAATWTVENGSTLPSGLTLTAGGVLSGTPTVAGTTSFSVRATNSFGYGVRDFSLTVTPVLITFNTHLPNATIGTPYTFTLSATGGTPPYHWNPSNSPAILPDGLTFPDNTITGTPTAYSGGEYSINIVVSDSAGNLRHATLSLAVYPTTAPPTILNGTNFGTRPLGDVQIELDSVGNGGPYTWSVVPGSALPPGLALRPDFPPSFSPQATGGIIGVPTAPGVYRFILQVTDGGGRATQQVFNLTITTLEVRDRFNLPDAFANAAYSYTFNSTVLGTTWTAPSPLPPGLSMTSAGVLSGTPSQAGTYTFNFILTAVVNGTTTIVGRSATVLVSPIQITTPGGLPAATQGQSYPPVQFVASPSATYTWTATALPPGLSFSSSGVLSGTPTFGGSTYLSATATDSVTGHSYTKPFTLNILGVPPVLPSITNLADFSDLTLGVSTSVEIYAGGGTAPYTWSAAGLPPGLSLNTGSIVSSYVHAYNAELWGVPTQTGTYNITFSVTDSSSPPNTVTQTYTFSVVALDAVYPPVGVRGVPFSFYLRTIGGTGGPYTWSNPATAYGRLPAGLSLNTSTGVVSGTPLEDGYFAPRFLITDGTTTLYRAIGFSILTGAGTAATSASISTEGNIQLPAATANQFYSFTLTSGGAASFTWSVLNDSTYTSALPPGMTLSSAGVLSGIPNLPGLYSFFVKAVDSTNANNYSIRQFSITVTPLITGNRALPDATSGTAYTTKIGISGGTAPYTFALAQQTLLPPGLSLSSSGVLSGTPTAAGQYNFSLLLTDSSSPTSNTVVENFSIAIYTPGAAPAILTGSNLGTYAIGDVQVELDAAGGGGPYVFSVAPGSALPPGLRLRTDGPTWFSANASAGIIGVATTPGAYSFTLQAASLNGAGNSSSKTFNLTVTGLVPLDFYGLPNAFAGSAYSYTFTSSSPGTVHWSVSPGSQLPAGLSLSDAGVLSGTPTTAGNYNINYTVSDGTSTIFRSSFLVVSAVQITTSRALPNGTQGQPYTAVQFAATPASSNYQWSISGLPSGMSFSAGGSLSGTPQFAGNDLLLVTVTDSVTHQSYTEFATLNVVGSPFVYPSITNQPFLSDLTLGLPASLEMFISGGTAPYTWSAQGLPPGMALRTGNGTSPSIFPFNAEVWGVPTQPGSYNVSFSATDSSNPPVTVSRTYAITVVALDNDYAPSGTRGVPYSFYLRTFGGQAASYSWSIISGRLPIGLSLNSSTGVVSGTPLEDGYFSPQFAITNGSDTLHRVISFSISAGNPVSIENNYLLPEAAANQMYSYAFNARGAASFVWSVVNDATYTSTIPPGLSLSGNVLSGIPTTSGVYTFFIKAADSSNANNYSIQQFTLNVTPLVLTSNPGPGTVGVAYSAALGVSGGTPPYSWTLPPDSASLPPGLSLNSGVISGTPTSAGQYNFSLILTDSSNPAYSSRRYFWISILPFGAAPMIETYSGLGTYTLGDVQAQLQAEGGGGPIVWTVANGSTLPPGLRIRTDVPSWFQPTATAGLIGVATIPGSYSFTLQATSVGGTGKTSSQTFNMVVAGTLPRDYFQLPDAFAGVPYSFTFSSTSNGTVHWQAQPGSSLPPGLSLSDSGVLSGTPATPGNYNVNFSLNDGANTIYRGVSLKVSAIQITTSGALPNATQGQAYTAVQLTASPSSSYQWSANFLPQGMSLTASGLLSGTPQFSGTNFLLVTVTDTNTEVSYSKPFALDVLSTSVNLPSITSNISSTGDFVIGQTRSFEIFVNGGTAPYTWSAQGLPPGMGLRSGSGVAPYVYPFNAELWGAPTQVETANITLTVVDSANVSVSQTFTLNVAGMDIDFPPNGTRDVPFNFYLRALGGQAPTYTWAITSGRLPAGLSLNTSTGVISGTPLEDGVLSTEFAITNGNATLNRLVGFFMTNPSGNFSIFNYNMLPDAVINQPYNYGLGAPGGPPALNWTILSDSTHVSTVPAGLSLSSTGVLSGTPTTSGLYTFFVKATDASNANNYSVRQLTLNVTPLAFSCCLPNGVLGTAYSAPLGVSGGTAPYTWALSPNSLPLPPGLSLSNGVISGTPTSAGQYTFNLLVTDHSNPAYSNQAYFSLTISPP